ncbi:MFS general substrate transporter [Mycena maculata]|uniref:MFS general substrate transporter n=1 Tax=Mycena maculata TaxID=230809 RepID=A0AAD7J2J1_9AGAR|nr:MFS general substrate transporter [Mycena maculata]
MADPVSEKDYNSSDDGSGVAPEVFERPKGFYGVYSHPATQVAMLGLVCFMCPGLYNSLSGIGGGGQLDETTGANTNVALYSTFSVMAFFAGSVNNKLGSRLTLQLGSLGYGLYIAGFLVLNIHPGAKAFVITAGAILGICAGLLWTAQGSLMLAYPTEGDKAKFIAIFWAIFNMGGVLGSAVAFGQNFHNTAGSVKNGTYIVFLVLTVVGACIPLFMVDPKKMIRTDGTRLTIPRNPSWKVELIGLYVALKTDPMILLLFPMFLASNWFYTWQFNEFNGALFNIRTRSLNSMIYWSSQIVGSLFMAVVLDMKSVSRRTRAFIGWGLVFIMVFVVHIWGYEYQKEYTRASIAAIAPEDRIDFSEKEYVGRIFLYIFCGLLDAMWQTTVYWMMGAMSNDPNKLAYFTGFYKSIQSAGAAGVWRADAILTPYMNVFASTWALCAAGLLFALPMIYLRVHEHTNIEEEVNARMDEDGNILPAEVVAHQLRVNEKAET